MEAGTNGIEENKTYSIISFPGPQIPKEHRNMIINNLLRSLQRENNWFALFDKDWFFDFYHKRIEWLTTLPGVTARFSVLTDMPDTILGWSLIEGTTLHYVFVKGSNRGIGIGKALVPVKIERVSHITKPALNIWNKYPKVKYIPL